MTATNCPHWCATVHRTTGLHEAAPVVIQTAEDRFVVEMQAAGDRDPYLTLAHWYARMDPADPPATAEPDNVFVLKLPVAAELVAAVSSLIARALGGAR